jgi:DNA-binding NtrC family response regulator
MSVPENASSVRLGANWHQRSWMAPHILSLSANPELGQLRAMVLRQAGYMVNWPANKEEADKLLENESFDLLVIGHSISGQSARHFVEVFRTRNPQGKIVAVTDASYLMIKADKTVKALDGPEALLGAIEEVLGPLGLAKCS